MYIYSAMNLNQNLIAPLSGDPSGSSQPDIGVFNLKAMNYTDQEEWRDIPDWEGYYQVSSHGRVKSLSRYVRHYRGGERLLKEKVLKGGYNIRKTIHFVGLRRFGKPKNFTTHVLVAMAFLNFIPNGMQDYVVDHKDNNTLNNHKNNLQIITQRENSTKDQFRHNRTSKYTGVHWHKWTKRWRAVIRFSGTQYDLGYFTSEIAASEAYQNALKKHLDNGGI